MTIISVGGLRVLALNIYAKGKKHFLKYPVTNQSQDGS